jgi:hypothetical protein
MFAHRLFILLAICFVAVPSQLLAASVRWYAPNYLTSTEEASELIKNLSPRFGPAGLLPNSGGFFLTSGFSLKHAEMRREGITLAFSQNPAAKDLIVSIVFSELATLRLWDVTDSNNAHPWCVAPLADRKTPRNSILCVPTEIEAHRLIDALATLAVGAGWKPDWSTGIDLETLPQAVRDKQPGLVAALVSDVERDSPAAAAGLATKDILTSVNGTPCTEPIGCAATIHTAARASSGSGTVQLDVLRKNKHLSLQLHYPALFVDVAAIRKSADELAHKNAAAAPATLHFGLQVRPATEADVATFGLAQARGMVVLDVEKGSMAEKTGFHTGDVILEVNNSSIGDLALFAEFLHSGQITRFHVWRKGQMLDLVPPQSL